MMSQINSMSKCLTNQADSPKASWYNGLWHRYGKWKKISLWLHLVTPGLSKASQVQIWEGFLSESMPACLLYSFALVRPRWGSQWVEFSFWIYYLIIEDCRHSELRVSASYGNITVMENFSLKKYISFIFMVTFINIPIEKDSYTGIRQLSKHLIPGYL